jgi:prolyl-tRNA synthetase
VEIVVLMVRDEEGVRRAAESLVADLRAGGRRVQLDDRTDTGFGRRSIDWELKGVPVRLEVGPRDLGDGNVTVVTRHTRSKEVVPLAGAVDVVERVLGSVASELHAEALAFRSSRMVDVDDVAGAMEAGAVGFARVPWRAVGEEGEAALAAESLTVRCLQGPDGSLATDGDEDLLAVVGRAY